MPPPLALVLTILFILYLLKRDSNQQSKASYGLWVPCIWLMILGSRPVSLWLDPGTPVQSADALLEGSPIDRVVFLLLIVAGLMVLWRRHIRWADVFRNNVWLILFFVYCGVSLLWSDFPLTASKRWVKALGDPIMALIILTECEPVEAIETVIKRCYYVLVPLSILFIKYYPDLGRAYDEWTGAVFYYGVNTNKNMLGFLCMVFGLFSVYRLCIEWPQKHDPNKRTDVLWTILLLSMNLWLLWRANSKTPLLSFILGIVVLLASGYPIIRQHIGKFVAGGILVYGVLDLSIGITTLIITSTGRDSTLTGRTELWEVLLNTDFNYWIGHGFESFWLGDRLKKFWALYYFKPNEAHNGYIEVYLNLGLIGLFLLGGMIFSCYNNIQKMLAIPSGPETAGRFVFDRFRLAYLLAYLIYNVSEAGFRPLNFVFVIFLIVSIRYPHQLYSLGTRPSSARLSQSHLKAARVVGAR